MEGGVDAARLKDLAAFAGSLSAISRPIVHKWFRHAPSIDVKEDASPVTIADKSIETALREAITARHPDHGIIGEEHGSTDSGGDFIWVIDPIDGTRAFSCGNPLFGTLIALLHEGRPIIGVIDLPALDQQWVGVDGQPTELNGAAVRTHDVSSLSEARLVTNSGAELGGDKPRFQRLLAVARVTGYGGDCANYAHLASGWNDCVAESGLKVHDIMACIPVISGAGGVISQWDGEPIVLDGYDGTALASATPALHHEAVGLLA